MSPEELRRLVAAELPDLPVAVALGGGADSAVAAWGCAMHPGTRAVFVDHDLAGSASLRSAARTLAEFVDLPLVVLAAPVEDGPNLESRARDARWRAIRTELAAGEVVVTGHSRDDLAETVLMNLLRGAGSGGLAAMSTARLDVVRPLLGVSRADLRELAEDLGLPFVDDPANDDPVHLRNRIRADLIPLLDREYQSDVRTTLARTAAHLAADDAILDVAAQAVPLRRDDGALLIPVPLLTTIPRPVAARVVRRALRRLNPPYAGTTSDVDAVLGVAGGGLASASLSSAMSATREGPYVALWAEQPLVPDPVRLDSPGSVRFGAQRLTAIRTATAEVSPRSTVFVDPGVLEGGVTVRASVPGERIDIAEGSKLVRDALAEAAVPVRKRAVWPVLAHDAKIAAVVAVRVAPWARPTGDFAVAVTQEPV